MMAHSATGRQGKDGQSACLPPHLEGAPGHAVHTHGLPRSASARAGGPTSTLALMSQEGLGIIGGQLQRPVQAARHGCRAGAPVPPAVRCVCGDERVPRLHACMRGVACDT